MGFDSIPTELTRAEVPQTVAGYLAVWAEVLRLTFEDARRFLARGNALSGEELQNGRKALRWLWDDSPAQRSFCWVCSLFDLEPGAVRRALAQRAGVSPVAIKRALGGYAAAG